MSTKSKPRVHKEEYQINGFTVTITTDTAFTNPKDKITLQIGDLPPMTAFQVDRLLGAFLRAIFFSMAGNGIPLDETSKLHPGLAADTAQQITQRVINDVANESFRRLLSDEGELAAMFLLNYQLVGEKPKLLLPGKEQTPVITEVLPEFQVLQLQRVDNR